ncbi:MAG TPA: putative sulfate/molybdate transporter, partial [Actinomycetota bacterium]|nr:putative sulfate/molybdate transporter [Actinomycetota bacterium]
MSRRIGIAEAGASVADLGTLLPITAALVLSNGIDTGAALGVAGALFVLSGAYYGVPMPVQPIKAAAAIAIATGASAEVIAAAGVLLGAVLLVLGMTRAAAWLHRVFPKPVIRGNQLGVGVLLVLAAERLVRGARGSDTANIVVAAIVL